jgi:competence protein ComEA
MYKFLMLLVAFSLSLFAAVNVNTASVEELTEISGIGEVKAQRIVEYREKNGNFKSLEELTQVKGIGEGTIDKLKSELEF